MTRDRYDHHLAAVLFDMDGLLVDTEPLWFTAERRVVSELGGHWSKHDQEELLGSNLEYAAAYMVRLTGCQLSPEHVAQMLKDAMTDELRGGEFVFRPGALELLQQLTDSGVSTALVTSSVRDHLDLVVEALPGNPFDVVVTGDDVEHKKPHPEPYESALRQLHAPATRCVVLEDSPAGVASAEAAGCAVIAVPSVVAIPAAARRIVVGSLLDVDLGVLQEAVTPS